MTDITEGTRNGNPMKILGIIIPVLPSILIRFSGEYLRFRSKATRGGRIFQNELLDQGIDETAAKNLTKIYMDGSNILKYMFSFRNKNISK
jgi:hypothetical protein